ncbi:MAG: homocysteine S-methyltransferase family protein, partial [Candidatus Limnocylindrales bacterium]
MDARARFRDRLAKGPLLADGAMGTLLFSRGVPQRAVLDELVATRPELIGTIHREYLAAGADIIETATFGANRVRLAASGLGDRAGRLSRRGAQIAREARDVAGRDVLVAGSVGPLGAPGRELRHLDEATVRSTFRETIDGLLEGGVDLFWFETFSDIDHLAIAVAEARSAAVDLPVVALLTFGDDIALSDGTGPADAAHQLAASADVDVIGVNCGAGPVGCLDALTAIGIAGGAILPNAGLPQRIEGQFVYAAGPDYLGSMVGAMLDAGAHVVGGCCGTGPEHIAAMRAALDARASAGPGLAMSMSGALAAPAGATAPAARITPVIR